MLDNLKNKITSKIGLELLKTQRHSPVILLGVGAVGVIGTALLASRATLQMDEILKESEKRKADIEKARAIVTEEGYEGQDFTEQDAKAAGIDSRVKLALKVLKVYAPAIAVGIITVGAFTGSHVILNRRYLSVSAAYAAVDKAFKQYRSRVVTELGKTKDEEFRYGLVDVEVAVDDETGTHVETVKVRSDGNSMYGRLFDENSKIWQRESGYNSMRIGSVQNQANDRLNAVGYVFLNDVYKWLGLEPSRAGQAVGWLKHGKGDGFVSFGIFDDVEMGDDFISGDDRAIWLDFNVDGPIWDALDEIAKEKRLLQEKQKAKKANVSAAESSRRFAHIRQER